MVVGIFSDFDIACNSYFHYRYIFFILCLKGLSGEVGMNDEFRRFLVDLKRFMGNRGVTIYKNSLGWIDDGLEGFEEVAWTFSGFGQTWSFEEIEDELGNDFWDSEV